MGYSRTERVLVKKEFLRMLVKINPAKMELINGFFETYLTLNESEEKVLMEEIKQLNPDESEQILKLPNSWVEKGLKEGIQKGESEGKRKIALNMLKEGLSIELIVRVTNLDYTEIEKIIKHNL
jgi:predicted transposase/invertase (TIGR01784 family)